MKPDSPCDTVCPIDRALEIVGDRWTLLILRELSMGVRRFDGIQAQTGISPHLLTTRLRKLLDDGLIERVQYDDRPPRFEYHRTQKGMDVDPVLMLLRSWGRKWLGDLPNGEPSVKLRDKKSGKPVEHLSQISVPAEAFTFDLVESAIGPTFLAERYEKAATFKIPKSKKSPARSKARPKAARKKKTK